MTERPPPDLERELAAATESHARGDLDAAERAYLEILRKHDLQPDALHYLGVVALQRGRFADAVELIESALLARPQDAGAGMNLGNAYQASGRFEAAALQFERLIETNGESAAALANLGNSLASLGRDAAAVDRLSAALALEPGFVEARRSLGDALCRLGRFDEALREIRRAAKNAPVSMGLLVSKGNIEAAAGHSDDAVRSYEQVLAMNPGSAPVRCNLGNVLRSNGRLGDAIDNYRRAIADTPQYVEGHVGLGIALKDAGETGPAIQSFRDALSRDPGNAAAYHGLAGMSASELVADDRRIVRARIDDPATDAASRTLLGFTEGRCLEAERRHQAAADQFIRANASHRAGFDYDVGFDEAFMGRLATLLDAEHVAQLAAEDGRTGREAVFIVGMPRSGTTLVEQILASHPQVHGAGELSLLPRAIASILPLHKGLDYSDPLADVSRGDLQAIASRYLESLRSIGGNHARITDKLPNNFLHIGLIAPAMPAATIIHCQRDPRATCFSIFKHFFAASGHRYAYDLDELARYFIAYESLMAHWKARFPDRVHTVAYEDLVNDTESTARALVDATGLEFDPACLAFYENRRPVATISASQVRQPIYRGANEAHEHYAAMLKPLVDRLEASGIRTRATNSSP